MALRRLCFDFGNTRKKGALFEGKKIVHRFFLTENENEQIKNIIQTYQPKQSILSSVIEHNRDIEKLLSAHTQFILLNHTTSIPIFPSYTKPEHMGADRIALAVATQQKKNAFNHLIIALGTCITYNFINSERMFLGGSISPGVQIRFKSMNDYTNLLPLVKIDYSYPLIGYDTVTNLLSGVLLGVNKEIDGVIEEYQNKYNKLQCVLTGGDAYFFAKQLKNKIFVDDDFLFKGLYEILEYNYH